MWIALVGLTMMGVATLAWMAGFGRIVNADRESDILPEIYALSVGLAGLAIVGFVIGLLFVVYGLVESL